MKGPSRIMFSLPNDHLPYNNPAFTGLFYFETDDIDQLHLTTKDKVNLCYPPEDFEYGLHKFAFWDNNGYCCNLAKALTKLCNPKPETLITRIKASIALLKQWY